MRQMKDTNLLDLRTICSRFGDTKKVLKAYDLCQQMNEQFWIDCVGPPEQRYRCGFDRVLFPEDL